VGLCLLKDIVSIHNLPAEDEQEMMARISQVISPGHPVQIPERKRKKEEAQPKELKYSPPMKRLVDEHAWIKRWLALIPRVLGKMDLEKEETRRMILDGLDFIRTYADRYHHEKEENVLFSYFDENLDLIKVIREDHRTARSHVRAILEAMERKDKPAVTEHLLAYRQLLSEHIKKEDEIMLPWMDRKLTVSQVGELFSKFQEAEEKIGFSPGKYEDFVLRLEEKFQP
jgi:hemerythrin-like domain-containing protein